MNLQPQSNFTIVRQIADHTDAGTYYVRAVVRNAQSDVILDTLDLDDKGSLRFKKDWQAPADVSGQGFYISIVTSVYSDSGYTTKSPNYGDEEHTYLVQDRLMLRGGGGGTDLTAVRRIIKSELASLPQPEPVVIPTMPWDDIFAKLDDIAELVRNIAIPEVNLEPVLSSINDVKSAVVDKPVTPATDITPITDELSDIRAAAERHAADVNTTIREATDNIAENVGKTIHEELENVEWQSTFTTNAKKGEIPAATFEERPIKSPLDIRRLAD